LITQTRAEADSEAVSLRLFARTDAVGRALAGARLFAERTGLAASVADRLAVVVEEWVMNIVEHGAPRPDSFISLRFERRPGDVRVSFTDAGVAFDPRKAVFEGPDMERGGGAGIALIRAWSRFEAYSRRRGRNRLTLVLADEDNS